MSEHNPLAQEMTAQIQLGLPGTVGKLARQLESDVLLRGDHFLGDDRAQLAQAGDDFAHQLECSCEAAR